MPRSWALGLEYAQGLDRGAVTIFGCRFAQKHLLVRNTTASLHPGWAIEQHGGSSIKRLWWVDGKVSAKWRLEHCR